MKRIMTAAAAFMMLAGTFGCTTSQPVAPEVSDMKAPIAKKVPHKTTIHGYERIDNYHWMRDRNNPRSQEIIDYLEEENAYTDANMKPYEGMVDTLYNEMLGRTKQDDSTVPVKQGDYWYFNKTEEGKQYPSYLRSKDRDGKDPEVLIDQNELAKGHKFFSISAFNVSEDGNWLAFSTDTNGYRQYTMQFKDLRTGEILPEKIERVSGVTWASDNKNIFYITEDANDKRNNKLWRHEVGTTKHDELYEEKDNLYSVNIGKTRDNKYIFLVSGAATMTEYKFIPANEPAAEWKMIAQREKDHEYSVDHWNGEFYITTNKNAENSRVVKAPVDDPSEKNWKEFIAHNPNIKIEGIEFFRDNAVVSELENGLEYLKVLDLKNNAAGVRIPTTEEVYTMGTSGNREFDSEVVRYNYSSMVTPNSTYEYNFKTGKSDLLKQQEIPSGHDPTQYETKRLWADARDGVKVPISIIYKKGTVLDGKSPMLLYAYGSYGYSMTPNFSAARLSLVDRGMVYAIAHIRGGSELGEKWRQDGRMFKKLNTFHDFIDSAKWLIGEKYTSSDRLVIQGGSAGGLLMGGVMNMSPETFKAALVQVPFVDVLNTMLDDTLPLTTGEWIEWGNPNEKEAFDYMAKYSPYDNIEKKAYPNMIVQISLYDSQVLYWEGAKYAAKIREFNTGDSKVLLKTNMSAGHGGSSGRYDRLKEIAFEYSYALSQVGITK